MAGTRKDDPWKDCDQSGDKIARQIVLRGQKQKVAKRKCANRTRGDSRRHPGRHQGR